MSLPGSIRSIPHQIRPQALAKLERTPLLPLLVGFSQFVSTGVARSRRVADGMTLSGASRLAELQAVAPRLRDVIEQLLADGGPSNWRQMAEETDLLQALIEFCLGWLLYLLSQVARFQAMYASTKFCCIWQANLSFMAARRHGSLKCPTPA
jgi:hypothetical protein